MRLSLEQVINLTGGRLSAGTPGLVIEGISTDSRTIKPGQLFVPLRGENFDGHDFLVRALRNGAAACLSEEVIAGLSIPVIRVEDTLKALGDLAAGMRREFDGPVVAVTGSSGKTTTKEMLATVLAETGPGLKTEGNYNNLIGLPLTLFRMESECGWAVLEMGMSERREIARLAEIARPTVGIITNVGPAHLETLGGIEGVARAKGELFAALKPGSFAIFNADDEKVVSLPVANGVTCIGFGMNPLARVRAEEIEEEDGEVRFTLVIDEKSSTVKLPVPGKFHVMNALAAAAAALALKVELGSIVAGLQAYRPLAGRMQTRRMAGGIVLLEDFYNANPLSMRAALEALSSYSEKGRRIAILGDMLELGPSSEQLHRQVGEAAVKSCDLLVAFGSRARDIAEAAASAGLQGQTVTFEQPEEVVNWLLPRLQAGDRLLIKGSRGMRMERIGEVLDAAWQRHMAERG